MQKKEKKSSMEQKKEIRNLSKKYTQVKGCFKIYYFNNSNKQNYKQNIMYNKLDIT